MPPVGALSLPLLQVRRNRGNWGFSRENYSPQKKHSTVETDSYLIYCSSAHGGLSHIERAALVKLSKKIHGVERERAGRARMAEMPHVGSCALVGAGRDPVVLYN